MARSTICLRWLSGDRSLQNQHCLRPLLHHGGECAVKIWLWSFHLEDLRLHAGGPRRGVDFAVQRCPPAGVCAGQRRVAEDGEPLERRQHLLQ